MFKEHHPEQESVIRGLTEEEIARAKAGTPRPLRKTDVLREKFIAKNLVVNRSKIKTDRDCIECGRKIEPNERAFPVYADHSGGRYARDGRTHQRWRCEECYLIHEEKTIASHTAKGYRKRFLMGSKDTGDSSRKRG